jgi:hypothetical protein
MRTLTAAPIFTIKRNSAGEIVKYKCRVVGKGYRQLKGIDFDEICSNVVRYETVKATIAIAAA